MRLGIAAGTRTLFGGGITAIALAALVAAFATPVPAAAELLVAPALRAFKPDMIVVASGLDANGVDPLARMLAHAETFRAMARQITDLAQELCGGRLLCVHEGGYSELMVPFCGLAIVETLSGEKTDVIDPMFEIVEAQQPPADMIAFQRARLEAQAKAVFG